MSDIIQYSDCGIHLIYALLNIINNKKLHIIGNFQMELGVSVSEINNYN